jgi:hypothetical protein
MDSELSERLGKWAKEALSGPSGKRVGGYSGIRLTLSSADEESEGCSRANGASYISLGCKAQGNGCSTI